MGAGNRGGHRHLTGERWLWRGDGAHRVRLPRDTDQGIFRVRVDHRRCDLIPRTLMRDFLYARGVSVGVDFPRAHRRRPGGGPTAGVMATTSVRIRNDNTGGPEGRFVLD